MRVSAKVDYAVRAAVELAAAEPGVNVKAEAIAGAQEIPRKFLDNILQGMRQAGIVEAGSEFPARVRELSALPGAWERR